MHPQGLIGMILLLGIAFILSNNRRKINYRIIGWGLSLQFIFGILILKTPLGKPFFGFFDKVITRLISFSDAGSDFLFKSLVPVGLWVQAVVSLGLGRITIIDLIRMRLRKIPPRLVTDSVINSHKAGLDTITTEDLETHFLAGGNVANVVSAMIAADKAKIELPFTIATAIDLAGRDVKTAVQTSVYPKVIDAPKEGTLAAVAKDGIEVKARARVTVRTNIPGLVGGATDETIIARVGEGIVSAIGSSETYKKVLENPDNISKAVLSKGLDAGTAYEILSIDIADVDLGKNIGARLQADQAEADLRVAQARAETRRAMAVAEEQEMKARTQQMQATVVEAEAEVPKAMSQAFRDGNLGIFDYYNMKNIKADTGMRDAISGEGTSESTKPPEAHQ